MILEIFSLILTYKTSEYLESLDFTWPT